MFNEKYSGVYHYNNETFKDIYPQIVPSPVFETIQTMISNNKYGKRDENIPYLFRNKMICGYCGKPVTAETGTSHNKSVRRYYKCSGKKRGLNSCNKSVIRKDILENTIINAMLQLLNGSEVIDMIAEQIVEARNKREADQSILNLLKEEKRSTEQSLDNIVAAIEKGITSKTTQRRLDELEAKMQKLEEQIAFEECREIRIVTKEDIIKYLKFAIKKEPKTMIDLLIKQIVLYDDKIEIYYNYTDKISPDGGGRDSVLDYGSTRVPLLPPNINCPDLSYFIVYLSIFSANWGSSLFFSFFCSKFRSNILFFSYICIDFKHVFYNMHRILFK